ncbi:MAG TPA: hypothetical protein VFH61_13905 [Thermoleophilia bacterium]|nr:hypothetical protein [Thermoleophilia bacterium]
MSDKKSDTERLIPEAEVREILFRIMLDMNTPIDPTGLDLAHLEAALRGRVSFLYGFYEGTRQERKRQDRRHDA